MATKYLTVSPVDFLNGLLSAGKIKRICDLWQTDIATIQTDDGELISIGSERTWAKWLYGENGKPVTPQPTKQLLLGIKYRELMGDV